MERTLRNLWGVLDVKAKLTNINLGEAEILYNSAQVGVEDLIRVTTTAGGDKHEFQVVSLISVIGEG